MKALDNALSDNTAGNCINPINVREALMQYGQRSRPIGRYAQAVSRNFSRIRCTKSIWKLLEKEITRAFVYSYQEQADALYSRIISIMPKPM